MLAVDQAATIVENLVQPLSAANPSHTDVVALIHAYDRILAAPIVSPVDFPHWDNSAMDGYAVQFADVHGCTTEQPVTLTVVEEIPAGQSPRYVLQSGQAARILTGAMMPVGADTVVMQEQTRRNGATVTILAAPPAPGTFVRRRGDFCRAGDRLLPAGVILRAPDLAMLAAAQCSQVTVYRKPRVAILSTGSELAPLGQSLQPGQIVDSNQVALAALVTQSGGIPINLGIVPDSPDALKEAIARALTQADLIVSSGGVSVGDYDYVEQILLELGATLHVQAVAIKPGKPLTVASFASVDETVAPSRLIYFGLPGNPVSALVTFWRFVQPALRKLSGLAQGWQPQFVAATTLEPLRSDGKRETYLWGRTDIADGGYQFHLAGGSHNSGNLINLAQVSALAILPIGQREVAAGDRVRIMLV
ncbi:MAG: molybdopterin molybdotransferase MoeA [Cyanobacteria bacterium]|nr:molybdopterin molybdotransferase MoeA [Cyanobacteriota bacterium]MDW8200134.1 molybdopterin molybdotransferase MoeA [Cyanobacteriota bacterium SKYGB_h_bin112]